MLVPWLSIFRPFLDPNLEKMSFSTIFLTSTLNLWWLLAPAPVKNLTSKNWTKKVSAQVWFALEIPVRQLITKTNVTGHVTAQDFWKFREQRKIQFNVSMEHGGASKEQSVLVSIFPKIIFFNIIIYYFRRFSKIFRQLQQNQNTCWIIWKYLFSK